MHLYAHTDIQTDLEARAQMTSIQCLALARRLANENLHDEVSNLSGIKTMRLSQHADQEEVFKWIRNGWNTEHLLHVNRSMLSGDALKNSLHWAFPQAYYSVYALTFAFFRAAGYPHTSHQKVIFHLGQLMYQSKYPRAIAFLASGGLQDRSYRNLSRRELGYTLEFDSDDPKCVDAQIAQFLNSTRTSLLKERLPKLGLKTIKGTPKKRFSAEDYDRASKKIGHTNLLSLLYRKRIKANYQDIDTLVSDYIDPSIVYSALEVIVGGSNLVHESFLFMMLGRERFGDIVGKFSVRGRDFVADRFSKIKKSVG